MTVAKKLYHIGALFVEMNELARAASYFERILAMPEPPAEGKKTWDRLGACLWHISKIVLARYTPIQFGERHCLANSTTLFRRTGSTWLPSSFEDAQAGALTQLGLIAQREQRLDDFITELRQKRSQIPKISRSLKP